MCVSAGFPESSGRADGQSSSSPPTLTGFPGFSISADRTGPDRVGPTPSISSQQLPSQHSSSSSSSVLRMRTLCCSSEPLLARRSLAAAVWRETDTTRPPATSAGQSVNRSDGHIDYFLMNLFFPLSCPRNILFLFCYRLIYFLMNIIFHLFLHFTVAVIILLLLELS